MYSREIDEQKLTLSASGWTYNFTFVLWDYETESLWYHLEGTEGLTCIQGAFLGRVLPERTTSFGRWSNWVADNPGSLYMTWPNSKN